MSNSMRLVPNMCPSLTNEIYDKLVAENISNVLSFLLQNPEELSAKTRISYKIIQNLRKILNAYHGSSQHSGLDLYNEAINASVVLSTGYECLDKVLGGGLLTEEVIEICGLSGVGKSSFCFSLSLNVASHQKKNVLYVDTTYSVQVSHIAEKIQQLYSKQEDVKTVLSRIYVIHPDNIWELLRILEDLLNEEMKCYQNIKFHLLIIDSLPHLIYPLIGGSQFESFGILSHFWDTLTRVIKLQKMAAVIVNHAIKSSFDTISLMPALGRYWAHVPHIRLIMEKSTNKSEAAEETLLRIVKSTRLNKNSCSIKII